jgi:hypothetical protein
MDSWESPPPVTPAVQRAAGRSRTGTGVLLAVFAGLLGGGICRADAPDPAVADERLEASYNAGTDFIRYPALDAYLGGIVRRLQGANPDATAMPVRIHELSSPLPYAFLLDNGACYVSSGLIARLDGEAELAAMIALPYAAVVRHDRKALSAAARKHEMQSFLPNILIITATAGLGGPALVKADAKKHADERAQAQAASDAVALGWLASAGYDPKAAALALWHLHDRLAAENRPGTGDLSEPALLEARARALEDAAAKVGDAKPSATPIDPGGNLKKLAIYYSLRQAALDIDSHAESVGPELDRVEAAGGETGASTFYRAELLRQSSPDDAQLPTVIAAFERCVAHADAPVAAYRDLGYLYRRRGDTERARQSFNAYLTKAPNASDAPIIRTYLESP